MATVFSKKYFRDLLYFSMAMGCSASHFSTDYPVTSTTDTGDNTTPPSGPAICPSQCQCQCDFPSQFHHFYGWRQIHYSRPITPDQIKSHYDGPQWTNGNH